MEKFRCHLCERVFKRNAHLNYHLNKKIPCNAKLSKISTGCSNSKNITPINPKLPKICDESTNSENIVPINPKLPKIRDESTNSENIVPNDNMCNYCNKIFSKKANAVKHMKYNCQVIKQQNKENKEENEINERLKLLELENDKMKKEIMELKNINNNQPIINKKKSVIGDNNTINNTNNINNTTNNNIIIVACGKEDMSKINKKDILKALNTGFMSPVSLIEKTHFNDEHPEYHNIFIPDLKNAHAQVHDGTRWVKKNTNDVIDELYDKNIAYIGYALDNEKEMIDKLKQSKRNALNELILIDADHDEFGVIKRRKTDMRYLLHNKKYIPLNTMQ
jgi:hypothetical protein